MEDKVKEYSDIYRGVQNKLVLGFMIIIEIISVLFLGGGIFLIIYNQSTYIIVAGVILILSSFLDAFIGLKFYKRGKKLIKETPDIECYKRYCKITGKK